MRGGGGELFGGENIRKFFRAVFLEKNMINFFRGKF